MTSKAVSLHSRNSFAKGKRSDHVSGGVSDVVFDDNIFTSFIGLFTSRSQTGP
jgi:hypothetical protein